ncbi:hypothetical protein BMETH_1934_1 [methanotrophic bacterial endosymbiont of Bathymodiolus sp.]|nr:hypothetical protein BMETH_1934_1 [methanotrophic bacterial endosymbiont of Bathymodiolus sp.]
MAHARDSGIHEKTLRRIISDQCGRVQLRVMIKVTSYVDELLKRMNEAGAKNVLIPTPNTNLNGA